MIKFPRFRFDSLGSIDDCPGPPDSHSSVAKKISETNPKYRDYREQQKEDGRFCKPGAFGRQLVNRLHRTIKRDGLDKEALFKGEVLIPERMNAELQELLKHFFTFIEEGVEEEELFIIEDFLLITIDALPQEVRQELQRDYTDEEMKDGDDPEEETEATRLWLFSLIHKIEDYQFLHALEIFNAHFDAVRERFESLLPQALNNFRDRILPHITSGRYEIFQDVLERRINEVDIRLVDPIQSPFLLGAKRDRAECHVEANTITIALTMSDISSPTFPPTDDFDNAITHELLHQISGRVTKETVSDYRLTRYDHPKTGMSFSGQAECFTWLDEAVTEKETQFLLGANEEDGVYEEERLLLDTLLKSGSKHIAYQTVLDAYFDTLDPAGDPGSRLPKWKTFSEAMREAYSDRFLVRLDAYIYSFEDLDEGLEKATELLLAGKWQEIEQVVIDKRHENA